MRGLQPAVRPFPWLSLGVAMLLVAGCATMPSRAPTRLSGAEEVPPVTTVASGTADISVDWSKCPSATSSANCPTVYGVVTTSGLEGTTARIHEGARGQNGPVVVTLVKTRDSVWVVPYGTTLNDAQYRAYWAGQLYVNVDSDAHKGGEIRAQLQP
jgi:CHRD domain